MFQSNLARLAARARARWVMIAGSDGVLLETDSRAFRTEAEAIAAQFASLFRISRKVAGDTESGGLQSALLVTEQGKILLQALNEDYILILFLEPDSHAGKAFFEISRAAGPIEKELRY
ncbi:MAG: roadblock/LC7 domain-containing protein [Acidobacteriota bacterium]|jgi:predicted regulator of Ras-like GTPase activity (Roadblock/LC7/MglB family)